ncbi:unnamed protein product [Didymodactylos carnosus]|uniref:Mitochondrial carrier protein n=1 Tax=Didymodactylos carnosus TaxID=1234261 RepID=A0A8S2I2H1_9BILA|nr:unnamed protein product [Didymodactylos carnosus]CAF3685247.1 unnamed protein product [Didymodactylos carnosus]
MSTAQPSLVVACDLMMQRLMIKPYYDRETPSGRYGVRNVIDSVYHKSGDGGLRGFYKGYLITLAINVPFSSVIWTLYWRIQHHLEIVLTRKYDYITSPLSAVLASGIASLITQPIDVLKTRLQVQKQRTSVLHTLLTLIEQRGALIGLMSGILPRAMMVIPNCTVLMSLYEYVKRISVKTHDNDGYNI